MRKEHSKSDSSSSESSVAKLRDHAKDPLVIFATGFGIGWFPRVPGTIASIVIAGAYWFLVPEVLVVQYALIFALFLLARVILGFLVQKYGADDAPCIVLDEFLGMAIALILVPKIWWLYLVAFVLFRILDIVKPWPISWIDANVKGAYGIILDDVIAGVFAAVITHLIWFTQG